MPDLILGPLLRYVSDTEATVWVETCTPCTVTVLDRAAQTFTVSGHHYALVLLDGLQPGSTLPYEVTLDGVACWPPPHDPYPPCVIRTHTHDEQLRLAFGSCRVSVPHTEPYVLSKDDDPAGREVDALLAFVERMRHQPTEEWPDALLLLGDQVYADEVSPETKQLIASRRGPDGPPPDEVGDFEEYTALYHESWSDPALRWLLSTVSSAMIFDDHDVHDDWNISEAWIEQMRAKPWWEERILGAYTSYWIYQHLGNLSPAALFDDPIFCAVQDADGDCEELVRDFARTAAREIAGARWSFCRDFGRTRLVVVDSRAGRVLAEGRRQMLSDAEWDWVEDRFTGDFDHLIVGTSLPFMLAPGMHHLEAWNEAVCDGAWGKLAARTGEKIRQALDLEHWAAFQGCFARLTVLLEDVAAGRRGPAPATITLLSGDVHHAYLAEAWFPGRPVTSRVLQVTCSPVRNPLDKRERRVLRSAFTRPVAALARRMARAAGVAPSPIRWAFAQEPTFDNQIARLDLCGRDAHLCIEKTLPEDWQAPRLHTSLSLGIAPKVARDGPKGEPSDGGASVRPVTVASLELDLEVFSGPFDLLLTLVLREEIDLLEVQLAEIVIAYLDHLEARGELDLEVATEFLVLIAALLELKSRLMLPREDDEPDFEPGEAAEELLARMLEAQRYRRAAEHLAARLAGEAGVRYRCAPLPPALRRTNLAEASAAVYHPRRLGSALGGLLRVPPPLSLAHLAIPRVTTVERLAHLRTLLRRGPTTFDEAVRGADRVTVAVTLFALLELYKQGEATWDQPEPFGAIAIAPVTRAAAPAWAGVGS